MMTTARSLGLLAFLALAACSSNPMPVLLQGEPMPVASLSGDWAGSYWPGVSTHRGSLKLYVGVADDSTFGDLTMFSPLGERIRPADESPAHQYRTRLPESLRLDLERVADGQVTGTLEPYIAPDCLCTVSTTFTGTVVGDTIRGTYVTRGSTIENHSGKWQLVRRTARTR